MKNYNVFKWDSHNSGYIVDQNLSLRDCREIAKRLSMVIETRKSTAQGENGWFEEYENGEKTSWSA